MNKPNLILIANWITALRSGKYEQGQGCLIRQKKPGVFVHCCLGVACEVAGLAPQEEEGDYAYVGNNAVPPDVVNEEFGEHIAGIDVHTFDGVYQLHVLNDKLHYTFAQIARALELHFNLSPYRN